MSKEELLEYFNNKGYNFEGEEFIIYDVLDLLGIQYQKQLVEIKEKDKEIESLKNIISISNEKLLLNTKLVCYKIRENFLKEEYFDVDIKGKIKYIEMPYFKFIKLLEQIEKGE